MDQSSFHLWAVTIGTAATALFTGVLAWGTWRQQRERITIEWEEDFHSHHDKISISGVIRNHTSGTINAWRLTVKGPVTDVRSGKDKHESWAPNECYLRCEAAPGSSSSFSFSISPDWPKLHLQTQQWRSRLKTLFAKLAWKLFSGSMRVHHGASLHFKIIIDSKSKRRFRKRITATIFIPPATVEKMMANNNIQTEKN